MEKVVQVIPARKAGAGDGEQGATGEREKRKLRVAAYCRVSTEQEEQLGSFANQVEYYTRLIEGVLFRDTTDAPHVIKHDIE